MSLETLFASVRTAIQISVVCGKEDPAFDALRTLRVFVDGEMDELRRMAKEESARVERGRKEIGHALDIARDRMARCGVEGKENGSFLDLIDQLVAKVIELEAFGPEDDGMLEIENACLRESVLILTKARAKSPTHLQETIQEAFGRTWPHISYPGDHAAVAKFEGEVAGLKAANLGLGGAAIESSEKLAETSTVNSAESSAST